MAWLWAKYLPPLIISCEQPNQKLSTIRSMEASFFRSMECNITVVQLLFSELGIAMVIRILDKMKYNLIKRWFGVDCGIISFCSVVFFQAS